MDSVSSHQLVRKEVTITSQRSQRAIYKSSSGRGDREGHLGTQVAHQVSPGVPLPHVTECTLAVSLASKGINLRQSEMLPANSSGSSSLQVLVLHHRETSH